MRFVLILVKGTSNWWHRIMKRAGTDMYLHYDALYSSIFYMVLFVSEWMVGYYKDLLLDNKVNIISKQHDDVNVYSALLKASDLPSSVF